MAQSIWYSDQFTDTGFDSGDNPVVEDNSPSQAIRGVLVPFQFSITATPVTGAKWRLIKVPKGAKLYSYSETTSGTSTACPGVLGWEGTGSANQFITDLDWEDADTLTVAESVLVSAVVASAETYLTATIGTVDTGGATTVVGKGAWFIP